MNHNILTKIKLKYMQQNPHPLARIMKPIFCKIDTDIRPFYVSVLGRLLMNEFKFATETNTKTNLILRLYNNIKSEQVFTFDPFFANIHIFRMYL